MAFRFEQLEIWKDAIVFAGNIYKLTKKFPRDEIFALIAQLRRSASSIPANIAEGSGSESKKEFVRYLDIAIKSVYETVSHLFLAKQQGYISEKELTEFYSQAEILVKKMQSFKKWVKKSTISNKQ